MAEQLHQKWNQPVLVENNSRGLNAGADQVSRATPDGYTILLSAPLTLTVANLLFRDITYHPNQFVPIAMLTKTPTVLSVRRNFPANNLRVIGQSKLVKFHYFLGLNLSNCKSKSLSLTFGFFFILSSI